MKVAPNECAPVWDMDRNGSIPCLKMTIPYQGAAMTKGANGVWEVTLGPLEPGAYRYNFNVGGLTVADPRSAAVSESNNNLWSLVVVPGSETYDERQVPHGAVADMWIQFVGGRFNQPIIVGCTGVNAPNLYQYLHAGQIKGIIGGLQGAAEYESLIEKPGSATLGMPAQSWGHGLIILLLIIGNIGFLLSRKKKEKK